MTRQNNCVIKQHCYLTLAYYYNIITQLIKHQTDNLNNPDNF